MGATGLMVWFKEQTTRWLPGWAVEVALAIHFYEAVLATLAIVVWHFYHVIFDPDVYPMNWAWLDGRVSARWYRHEHPLDYARLVAAEHRAARQDVASEEAAVTTPSKESLSEPLVSSSADSSKNPGSDTDPPAGGA
jgi:hypothetical protein